MLALLAVAWAFYPAALPMERYTAPQSTDNYAAVKLEFARRLRPDEVAGLRMTGATPDATPFSLACRQVALVTMWRGDGETTELRLARGALSRHPPLERALDMLQIVFGDAVVATARAAPPRPGALEDFVLRHREGIDSGATCGA